MLGCFLPKTYPSTRPIIANRQSNSRCPESALCDSLYTFWRGARPHSGDSEQVAANTILYPFNGRDGEKFGRQPFSNEPASNNGAALTLGIRPKISHL
ncbi:MAG: hypothetical protein ACPG8W_20915 [Candidatus Promineifilaceae bacterium]